MKYFKTYVSQWRSAPFCEAEMAERGTWHTLMAFCAEQENGGRIAGAKKLKARALMRAIGVSEEDIEGNANGLWEWDGDDLVVTGYPIDDEVTYQAKREIGSRGGKSKGSRGGKAGAQADAKAKAQAIKPNPPKPNEKKENETQDDWSIGQDDWSVDDILNTHPKPDGKDPSVGGDGSSSFSSSSGGLGSRRRTWSWESWKIGILGTDLTEDEARIAYEAAEKSGFIASDGLPIVKPVSWMKRYIASVRSNLSKRVDKPDMLGGRKANIIEASEIPDDPDYQEEDIPM